MSTGTLVTVFENVSAIRAAASVRCERGVNEIRCSSRFGAGYAGCILKLQLWNSHHHQPPPLSLTAAAAAAMAPADDEGSMIFCRLVW